MSERRDAIIGAVVEAGLLTGVLVRVMAKVKTGRWNPSLVRRLRESLRVSRRWVEQIEEESP